VTRPTPLPRPLIGPDGRAEAWAYRATFRAARSWDEAMRLAMAEADRSVRVMSLRPVVFPVDPWVASVREEYRAMTEQPDTCPRCDEGEPVHPVNPDCERCGGSGHRIAGDAYRPCPACVLWGPRPQPTRSPFVARAMAGTLLPKVVA